MHDQASDAPTTQPQPECRGYARYLAPREFDIAECLGALSELEYLLQDSRPLVIDLRQVEFMDSSGASALVWADNRAKGLGGGVVVVGPSPRVLRLLELMQLDRALPVYGEMAEVPAHG